MWLVCFVGVNSDWWIALLIGALCRDFAWVGAYAPSWVIVNSIVNTYCDNICNCVLKCSILFWLRCFVVFCG